MTAGEEEQDRRRSLRRRSRRPVEIEPGPVSALTADISPGGVFVITARLSPPGSRLRLTFRNQRTEVQTEGVVRWVREAPGFEHEPTPMGMGIQFVRGA